MANAVAAEPTRISTAATIIQRAQRKAVAKVIRRLDAEAAESTAATIIQRAQRKAVAKVIRRRLDAEAAAAKLRSFAAVRIQSVMRGTLLRVRQRRYEEQRRIQEAIRRQRYSERGAHLRMFEAAKRGDVGAVRAQLAANEADPCWCEYYGRDRVSPLAVACAAGHTAVVEAILSTGPRDLDSHDTRSHSGATVLQRAAAAGHPSIVSLLLTAGAKVDTGSRGRSALHYAAAAGHVEVVQVLLRAGASPNSDFSLPPGYVPIKPLDWDKLTPLHCAMEALQVATAVALIEAGADEAARDYNGYTPRGRVAAIASVAAPAVAAAMHAYLRALPLPANPSVAIPFRPWVCCHRCCSSWGRAHTQTCPCRITQPLHTCLLCRCTEACRRAAGEADVTRYLRGDHLFFVQQADYQLSELTPHPTPLCAEGTVCVGASAQ
jgi:hypothetical protein